MPDQEILVLFNPKSGKGRAQEIASGIANQLSKSNFQIISGKDADETLALLRSKLSSNSLVISVGGDGLFNLALQGIKELEAQVKELQAKLGEYMTFRLTQTGIEFPDGTTQTTRFDTTDDRGSLLSINSWKIGRAHV